MLYENQSVWSLGVKVGLPVLILVLLIGVAIVVAAFRYAEEPESFWLGTIAGGLVIIVTGVGSLVGYWPLKAEYHKWYDVVGTVEKADKRLIPSGDSMSERFVIKFKESQTFYGCDDTRCALAEPGKTLTLACKREYVYNSQSGWGCVYKQES